MRTELNHWLMKRLYTLTYIMKKCYFHSFIYLFFVNHVKTNERINMELRPYNAKSFVDGQRLFFFKFHIPFPILSVINFHPYIFPPIQIYK